MKLEPDLSMYQQLSIYASKNKLIINLFVASRSKKINKRYNPTKFLKICPNFNFIVGENDCF